MPMFFSRSAALLALLVPALALISAAGGPAVLYLAGLLALVAWAMNVARRWQSFDFQDLMPMVVALGAPFAAMLVSCLWLGVWSGSEIEKLLRFALAIPVCWLLLRAPRQWLMQVQWSLLFAAYAGSLLLIVIMLRSEMGRYGIGEFGGRYNAVAFADLTLMFATLSLMTLPWQLTRWPKTEAALKILVVPLALTGVWLSQTRSSWVLLPVYGLVFLLGRRAWTLRQKAACLGVVAIVLCVAAFSIWNAKQSRWKEAVSDLALYAQKADRDTSVGTRIQLWHASWLMFKQNPLVGVGVANFRSELAKLAEQDIVTKTVAADYGEPHNDFLGALAGYGLLGVLSMLALYFVPAVVFWRRMRSDDPVIQAGAQMGMLFCLGYALFSLSEMMFRNMRSVPIYAVTVVLLYALTTVRKGSIPAPSASA
ncbi:O-antigen ligase family protein [Achromobacter sp. Marseille-Q0513]|uniref:O-antigen ligase family protein n=1 Tax=Achromobacter sp. Marseille-Q0513 TaxID=2829161 RepID=UPI001B976582|nr:O-antigen ligase family protein [Achromobacter sp. Marseille-Q0513]MBR8653397.1 O-antigen ligase family protein [Achromobacter sp. Marseille-Q0513]